MSVRIKRHAHVLRALATLHPSVRKAILTHPSRELINCISECCINVLNGNVPLSGSQKAKLTRYKRQIRNVAGKATSLKNKTKVIQTGGFITALLGPLLGSVLSGIVR